ncbi:NADH-quinone oxidoreductase subunit C, partial [Aquifex sp.]
MNWINKASAEKVKQEFKQDVNYYETEHTRGFEVRTERLKDLLKFLKEKVGFYHFVDLTCIDFPEKSERFQGVYILYNPEDNERVIVKAWAKEGKLPT